MISLSSVKIVDGATATGAGPVHVPRMKDKTFQAVSSTTAGAGTAAVRIDVSNDGATWIPLGTITLSPTSTTPKTDGFASNAAWRYVRGEVTVLTGTGATLDLWMGG